MQKRWNILAAPGEMVQALHESLKINPVLCQVLVQRSVETFEKARAYFRPQITELHDPWLMKDMEKATQRILSAFERLEKILVYGDYDVDGTTSVACMYQFLIRNYRRELVEFYIPHRYREGYGVSKAGIDFAYINGYSLIIALDCGIKSVELIEYAKALGIDFIVCDHHLPDVILPPAVAILNPKQADCNYPYKDLCGCGVGFKLISALVFRLGLSDSAAHEYLDLVATAIAADIVPMTGENRVLAFYGLKKANENPNLGIKAIKQLTAFDSQLHITNLVFLIAPRINAAGRMDDARKAVLLFIADSDEEAKSYAAMLHEDNSDRKIADQSITEEALYLIECNDEWRTRKSTVLFQDHWHKGVVGIVASRLIDHYYRPTIILTRSGDYAAGSARSVAGFNVYEAIHQCKDLLLGYGGHFYAAGMTLEIDNIPAFQQKFEEVVSASIPIELLTPEIVIDAEVRFGDLRQGFYNIIYQMEPYGPENLRPVFVARHVLDTGFCKVVKEEHVRFSLIQDNIIFTGIGFNMARKFESIQPHLPIDIVFTLEENEWNNQKNLQLKVIDFRQSGEPKKSPEKQG